MSSVGTGPWGWTMCMQEAGSTGFLFATIHGYDYCALGTDTPFACPYKMHYFTIIDSQAVESGLLSLLALACHRVVGRRSQRGR